MKPFVYPKKYPLRDRIFISFSGGKTSAYMTKMLLDHFRKNDPSKRVVVLFANTGQEHEETLKFVDRCDKEFGFGTVWLEAVVSPKYGEGIAHRVVNFETASRKGEPFEGVIAKYGIPNAASPSCTRDTKLAPMRSYLRSIRWKPSDYSTAVGIRIDEMDRVSLTKMQKEGYFYPCVDSGVTKEDIRNWWLTQRFNLNIPEHWGNCMWCWKKSNRKLLTIARNNPEFFAFPKLMEEKYPFAGPDRRVGPERPPRVFFRKGMSVKDILREAAEGNFVPFEDDKFIPFDDELDVGGACGDSCEIGADED